jgi:DNA primase
MGGKMIYNPDSLNLKVSSYNTNEALVLCPFHKDTNPSASFNLLSGLFYCFTCGEAHNAKSLAYNLDGTVEKTENYSSGKASYDNEKYWLRLLWNKKAFDNDYLKSRNVSDDLVDTFDIRANEQSVIFPIYNNENQVTAVQIRHYKRKPKYLTFGVKPAVYPLNIKLPNTDENIIICEGIFGAINLYRLGVNAYATLGAIMKSDVKHYIHQKYVYGLFDNDLAGYIAGARLLTFIPRAKIIVPGCEVDEISNAILTEMMYANEHTRYIPYLAKLSGDKEKFYKYVPKG